MALAVQTVVESRRYNGWIDPRYPIGYWQAALGVTGDGTGGRISLSLVFQTANGTERLNSQMFSVERISAHTEGGSARTMILQALNMGGPSNLGFTHRYAALLSALTGLTETALVPETMSMLPWFLGSQRTAGQTASLSLTGVNTDLVAFKFEAEGYRWDPRSVLVDGGPQRPPTGLYAR